jgi:hypothetical protein
MSLALTLLALLAILAIAPRYIGFRSQRPAHFAGQSPAFDPRTHLSGPILCEGMICGPFGRVTSRFVAKMEGVWDGNRGILREEFRYDSGEEQRREWRLTLGNDGTLRAEADDVVGTGTGHISGPAVQMLYNLRLPKSSGGHVLQVTDWMILAENGTILNRSQFTKFGIPVAQLFATMRRVNA